ncbi:MAG: hypothetical protein UY96_C0003G0061 [Parcubacteria group bacterium GW2011_GWB1_56_8]|nr:MAG: hypothetical protein UY96_C0003G0061 [Parcubacteria group bacterium GW2011_GWB1_56_8]
MTTRGALTILFALGLLVGFLTGCGGRALDIPLPPPVPVPCCFDTDGILVCKDATCPELQHGKECTTLAVDHSCQVRLTDDCQSVMLKKISFLTVYCF